MVLKIEEVLSFVKIFGAQDVEITNEIIAKRRTIKCDQTNSIKKGKSVTS